MRKVGLKQANGCFFFVGRRGQTWSAHVTSRASPTHWKRRQVRIDTHTPRTRFVSTLDHSCRGGRVSVSCRGRPGLIPAKTEIYEIFFSKWLIHLVNLTSLRSLTPIQAFWRLFALLCQQYLWHPATTMPYVFIHEAYNICALQNWKRKQIIRDYRQHKGQKWPELKVYCWFLSRS